MSQAGTSVAIVGPGAIGLALAASVRRRGHDLSLYGRHHYPDFSHTLGDHTERFSVPIVERLEAATAARWVLLTTKAYQTTAAGPWLERLADDGATLVVVRNGVDHLERVRPLWPRGRLLPAIISMPCARMAPNAVRQRRAGQLIVPDDPDGRALATLFDANVNVSCTPDWTTEAWTKLLINGTLGLCALAGATNGAVLVEPLRPVAEAMLREIIAVGRAAGAAFTDDDALVESTFAKIAKNPEHRSSITQDRAAGRPIEWEARNAVISRTADRFGVSAPVSRAVAATLAAADAQSTAQP